MLKVKEKNKIKGRDFRRVISQARKIYNDNFLPKNEPFAKKFSLNDILLEYEMDGKGNPEFIKGDSEIYCKFYSESKTGAKMIHALEIATIKCGMAFNFLRDNNSICLTLRYR